MGQPVVHFEFSSPEPVEAKGAKTIVPPMEIPGVGESAIFLDPEQRAIGFYKPLKS